MALQVLTLVNHVLAKIELAILQRITLGESNEDIAAALDVDVETVRSHVRSIMEKLMKSAKSNQLN